MICLVQEHYVDPDRYRNEELLRVAEMNGKNLSVYPRSILSKGRNTFSEIFKAINEKYHDTNAVCIFANSDIYFDGTAEHLHQMAADEAYALSRWDNTAEGIIHYAHCDSQDAWVFRGPIRQEVIDKATFTPGVRGCDNRLAAILHEAGYKVSNPSKDIKAIHLHRTGLRRYNNESPAVPKPYLLIEPHHLGEEPQWRFCPAEEAVLA